MKDLDKIRDVLPQVNFVERTMYSKDEPELDRFALKVVDLSAKFSKTVARFKSTRRVHNSASIDEDVREEADPWFEVEFD